MNKTLKLYEVHYVPLNEKGNFPHHKKAIVVATEDAEAVYFINKAFAIEKHLEGSIIVYYCPSQEKWSKKEKEKYYDRELYRYGNYYFE